MVDITPTLSLQESVVERIDREAKRRGRSREELIAAAVQRDVAGQLLRDVLAAADARTELTADEAMELSYAELDASRASRSALAEASLPDL